MSQTNNLHEKKQLMPTPRELYKSTHPDYFSDSEFEEATELDRTLLEFHLSSLTSRSQEADFERFARRLCEKEVCPNLLPTTGPTGGGDSKADSETFPVADSLTYKWYSGEGREASCERWAFAFSAKADWRSKVQSDVKKIVETERGYKKIFFVTNQSVPAKKRAEVEDTLAKAHGVEMRIMDRTWILERVFGGRHEEIAISELNLTGLKKQIRKIGPLDSQKIAEFEMLEKRIAEAVSRNQFSPALVDDALDSALLCRSLEKPRMEVEGSFARADRLARKYGTMRQRVESAYQWGWTLAWWFEDLDSLIEQYQVVEDRAKGSENVYDIERLSNLLTILTPNIVKRQNPELYVWLNERTQVLRGDLVRLCDDANRPSVSLHARTLLLQNQLVGSIAAGNDPSEIFDAMKEVVESAEGLVGFPLEPLVRSLTVIGNRVEDSPSFDTLFDTVVNVSSRRDGEVRAARLLLTRGEQLINQDKPTKAIAIVGQTLSRLYKHETRKEIVFALYMCANAYERLGLLWAARGAYLSGASIAANDYWLYEEISRGFRECVNGLKWIELRLGRLPQILAWHELESLIRHSDPNWQIDFEEQERNNTFEALVARLIVRISPESHANLGALTSQLDRLGLHHARSALLFLLGYPDRLEQAIVDLTESPESFINSIWALGADTPLSDKPELFQNNTALFSTKILGCRITVECETTEPCLEVCESLLATLESLVSTISLYGAVAYEPELTMEVKIGSPGPDFVGIKEEEHIGRSHLLVECEALDTNEMVADDKAKLRDEIFRVSLIALAHIVRFQDFERDIEKLFAEERVAERAASFTGNVGTLRNVLGNFPKFRIAQWLDTKDSTYPMKRTAPWCPTQPESNDGSHSHAEEDLQQGTGEPPEGLFDPDNTPHDQMDVVSPIRQRLWDRAGWTGAVYVWDKANEHEPLLGLLFKNREAGTAIFSSWFAELGRVDEKKSLGITIVRGIDKHHPHAYRVIVRGNPNASTQKNRLLLVMQRIHRMDATNSVNLDAFLKAYEIHRRFVLAPAFLKDGQPDLEFDHAIGLLELRVRNAWEIGLNDWDGAGVDTDDEVVVPEGILDPPVLKLQQWKRKHRPNG